MKSRGNILRKIATLAVTIIAAVASLATSPPESSIEVDPISGRVTLSPHHPEVRVPFSVAASDEALQGDFWVDLQLSSAWTDTAEAVVLRGPDVTIETEGEPERVLGASFSCSLRCVGNNELVIRWPLEAEVGEVTIDWSITVVSSFDDDEPPGGAELSLEVGEYASAAGPIWREKATLSSQPMIPRTTNVETTGAVSALALHRRDSLHSRNLLYVLQDDGWIQVQPERAIALDIPDSCLEGSCKLAVQTVASVGGVGPYPPPIIYEFVAAPGEESLFTVATASPQVWEASAASATTTVQLHETVPSLSLPVSAVLHSVDGVPPPLVTFSIAVEPVELANRVSIHAVEPTGWPTTNVGWFDAENRSDPRDFAMPALCNERECAAALDLNIYAEAGSSNETLQPVVLQMVVTATFSSVDEIDPEIVPAVEVGEPR